MIEQVSCSTEAGIFSVPVIINGQTFKGILDSGAVKSLITAPLVERLKLIIGPSSLRLVGASGHHLENLGQVKTVVTVDGQTLQHEFVVVKRLPHDGVLLGDDFLRASRAIIDWGSQSFAVSVPQVLQKVHLIREQTLPALSRKLVPVDWHRMSSDKDCVMVITGTKLLYDRYSVIVEPMVADASEKIVKVLLTNCSPQPIVLPSQMTVGVVEEAGGIEDIELSVEDCQQILQISCLPSPEDLDEPPAYAVVDPKHRSIQIGDVNFNVGTTLSSSELQVVKELLAQHATCFAQSSTDVGSCKVEQHCIPTGDAKPISQRPRRLSPAQRDLVKSLIKDLIDANIVRPSRSPWASPLVLVAKKDGTTRMCVDYRRLNAVTEDIVYPFPRIEDALQALTGSKYFSVMDLVSGFYQIAMHPDDIQKTAFVTPWGLYEFLRMPFGLKGAPFTCQRAVDTIIDGIKYDNALVYMDDCVVFSQTFEDHVSHLRDIFARFQKAALKFKPQKCFFFCTAINYLGHVVTKDGVSPDPSKLAAVQRFRPPRTVQELQSFMGLTSYFRKFIPNYSVTAAPLRSLLKKNSAFSWEEDQQVAFETLKCALCQPPVLKLFSERTEFRVQVHTDASRLGLGGLLLQEDEERRYRPVLYLSRALKGAEVNYSSTELEALAVKWALEQLRPYLIGRKFQVVSDHHALCWILRYKEGNQRLLRWSLILQEFDFDVTYKSGILHSAPDCLSRTPPIVPEKGQILAVSYPPLRYCGNMGEEQRQDAFCAKVLDLLNGALGTKKQQKRAQKKFLMHNEVLYRRDQGPVSSRFLLCLPSQRQAEALREMHEGRYGGHMGIRRTFEALRSKYYWPKLYTDVKRYVSHCDLCQRMKMSTSLPYGLLQPIEVHSPFHTVGMDIVGPFKNSRGYKYIIVAIDYLTKFVEAKPLRNIEATTVQKFIERRIVLKHGCPATIITDRGTQMMARSTEAYLKHRGITHAATTAYHPAANGLCERANKTIKQMIAMTTAGGEKWTDVLPYVVFCYNTGYQDTVRQTPFFLVYGRDPVLPLDVVYSRRELEELKEDSSYGAVVSERLKKARELAAAYIRLAQEKQKDYFNKHHKDVVFERGQLVLLKAPPSGVKSTTWYNGPHKVVNRLSPVNYEIELADNMGTDIVHVEKLKPYLSPIAEMEQPRASD